MSLASKTSSSDRRHCNGCSFGTVVEVDNSIEVLESPLIDFAAPYQGQLNHFGKFAKEKIPYAIERFTNETLRVYGVLEIRLSGKYTGEPREYLAGTGKGKYSVADIGTWPWVKGWSFSGLTDEQMKPFPHLLKWIDRIAERPAVKEGTGEKYNLDK